MGNRSLNELIERYLDDSISVQEVRELIERLREEENTEALQQAVELAFESRRFEGAADLRRTDILFETIMQRVKEDVPAARKKVFQPGSFKGIFSMWKMAAASVLLVVALSLLYRALIRKPRPEAAPGQNIAGHFKNDVPPGGNKAVLTLADGKTIVLDSMANGLLASQGGTKVMKLDSGSLSYHGTKLSGGETVYNIISTPRGGRYQVVLPDGTRVWLNAASSLQFPTAFTGKERKVLLTGEAYFEVAEDASQPFKVSVNGMEVKVLGTHFNVNAYADEVSANTTLLEGSVMVTKNNSRAIIRPGQQAQVNPGANQGINVEDQVDLESVMAWKNGRFSFNSASLENIMRQIARWYDIDVVFEDKITDTYTVDISRNVPVSALLRYLELSGGAHFDIDGRKIIVKK